MDSLTPSQEAYNNEQLDCESIHIFTPSQDEYLAGLTDCDEILKSMVNEPNSMMQLWNANPALKSEPMISGYDQETVGPTGISKQVQFLDCSTGILPPKDSYPGTNNFALDIQGLESEKGWNWSTKLNKLFIAMKTRIPIGFKWMPRMENVYIRAVMVYDHPNEYRLAIERCPYHIQLPNQANKDYQWKDHVLRADHPDAIYVLNPESNRRSVVMPLERAQPGTASSTVYYMFTCKNSCNGGLNRRPTSIIFTLEDELGQVLGRHTMHVRVCSCPKRDKEKEEAGCQNNGNENNATPGSKKRLVKTHSSLTKKLKKDHLFTLEIVGEDNYQFALKAMHNHMVGNAALEDRPLTDREKHYVDKYKSKML